MTEPLRCVNPLCRHLVAKHGARGCLRPGCFCTWRVKPQAEAVVR